MNSPDITVQNQVEVVGKPPPTFKEVTASVLKLTEVNPRAARLVQLLSEKKDAWEKPPRRLDQPSPQPVDQRIIGQVVSWLTYSSDFQSFDEARGFMEEYFRNSIDSQNQRLDREYQGYRGANSAGYREARDQLLATVESFVRANKKDAITNELNYWASGTLASGGAVLQNRSELERQLQRMEMGDLVIYMTREDAQRNPQYLTSIQRVAREMEQFVMGRSIDKGRMHILLVPDAKFSPRGGAASSDGHRLIVNMGSPDKYRVAHHEFVHALLGQALGASKSPALIEGAAMYFTKKKLPGDPRNDYVKYPFGFDDVADLARRNESVGISPTAMLEKRGKSLSPQEEYEYAYRFGSFLAEYIDTKFGREKYLEFYKVTCGRERGELYDNLTGNPLIQNGVVVPGVRQREIITQALRSVNIDPEVATQEFDQLIKARTLGSAK